jgi:hypothetical protein
MFNPAAGCFLLSRTSRLAVVFSFLAHHPYLHSALQTLAALFPDISDIL